MTRAGAIRGQGIDSEAYGRGIWNRDLTEPRSRLDEYVGVDLVWAKTIETPEFATGMRLTLPDRIVDVEVESLVEVCGGPRLCRLLRRVR